MPATNITIPVELVPLVEEWGKMTAKVFGQLRNSAGLKPLNVPKDQEWFWSKKWQAGEKAVDEDIRQGRVKSFNKVEDLIESLDL